MLTYIFVDGPEEGRTEEHDIIYPERYVQVEGKTAVYEVDESNVGSGEVYCNFVGYIGKGP
jgi:hypothetical protein